MFVAHSCIHVFGEHLHLFYLWYVLSPTLFCFISASLSTLFLSWCCCCESTLWSWTKVNYYLFIIFLMQTSTRGLSSKKLFVIKRKKKCPDSFRHHIPDESEVMSAWNWSVWRVLKSGASDVFVLSSSCSVSVWWNFCLTAALLHSSSVKKKSLRDRMAFAGCIPSDCHIVGSISAALCSGYQPLLCTCFNETPQCVLTCVHRPAPRPTWHHSSMWCRPRRKAPLSLKTSPWWNVCVKSFTLAPEARIREFLLYPVPLAVQC